VTEQSKSADAKSGEESQGTTKWWTTLAQVAFILVASLGVYSFVRAAQQDHRRSSCQALCHLRPTYANQNRRVPDFELPNMTGDKVKFSSFLGGKPVVLNFWTKTCEPCLEEMPMLADMAKIVAPQGVRVVTVCTDEGPDAVRDTLQVVLQGREPPFEILFDPESEIVHDRFGTTLFPETWLIDGEGIIRARVDGPRDWTGPFALEVVEMLSRPAACQVEFMRGKPSGPHAALCNDGA
jgi:thiol-disulfide isomerase/thioredoxin